MFGSIQWHCSFQNLFELCPKVLLSWRYDGKDFSYHQLFCFFLCFPPWKQLQPTCFQHTEESKRRGYDYCIMKKMTKKKKVHILKRTLMLTDYKVYYSSPQKVTERLGSEIRAEWNSIIFGRCQDNIKCSISPIFHNIWKKSDWDI